LHGLSRVLLLDPTYGEYAHVLERVVGCRVDRLRLRREEDYQLDSARTRAALLGQYDLVVLVNPNNPTGQLVEAPVLQDLLEAIEPSTRVWIDEAYIDYTGSENSLEQFAAGTPNVVVCKSLSKGLALSGARAAYLCGSEETVRELQRLAPPWWVSLTAQVAAVAALRAPNYYLARYGETRDLREELMVELRPIMAEVLPGTANFLLCQLPPDGPTTVEVIRSCRKRNLFLRDVSTMGTSFDSHALRIAVKDRETNQRMLEILDSVFLLR
jgi:histidinol-phosphate/aromatic aminotransferase/cobyric acid decarboxylase-like protein